MSRPWLRLLDRDLPPLPETADAEARLQRARDLNARCRHAEAARILDQLLAEDRHHGEAWFERIVALGEGRDQDLLDTLHRELEALRDEQPENATHRRSLGFLRLLQQRPDDAERALRQAMERLGQDPRTLELMGLLALQRDEPAEAKVWILKALTLQPKEPRTLRLLGLACAGLDDVKGAEASFVAALDVDAHYFWGWHSLGESLLKRGEIQDGLRCLNRARAIQPAEPASYLILSELFSQQGHLELAQGELHRLMLLAPPAPVLAEAYGLLGELRRDMGDPDGAVSYFSMAAETDQASPNPWVALGELARASERWEDALRCYREALDRDPGAADLQVELGYVLLKTGQVEEAEHAFLAALESDPSEYSAYLGLSELARRAGRREDQLRMVKEAMVLAPEDPDVWNAQGVALEVSGDLAGATAAYQKVLRLAPTHRKAANNLGFILEKRAKAGEPGLQEQAVEAWKRRLLLCRDEGQSLKMAMEHLAGLGVDETTVRRWLDRERAPEA